MEIGIVPLFLCQDTAPAIYLAAELDAKNELRRRVFSVNFDTRPEESFAPARDR